MPIYCTELVKKYDENVWSSIEAEYIRTAFKAPWDAMLKLFRYIDECLSVERYEDVIEYSFCDKLPSGFDTVIVTIKTTRYGDVSLLRVGNGVAIRASSFKLYGVYTDSAYPVDIYAQRDGNPKVTLNVYRYTPGVIRDGHGLFCIYLVIETPRGKSTSMIKARVLYDRIYIMPADYYSCIYEEW